MQVAVQPAILVAAQTVILVAAGTLALLYRLYKIKMKMRKIAPATYWANDIW